ncbi:fimbrial protein, partial [Bordetella bronchiseptica]
MLACEREHRGVSRVAVAAVLAGNMALAACAMPDPPDISRAPAGLEAGPEPAAIDTTPPETAAPRPAGAHPGGGRMAAPIPFSSPCASLAPPAMREN